MSSSFESDGTYRPAAPARQDNDDADDVISTGLRGLFDDLGVLFAIMLGQDMIPGELRRRQDASLSLPKLDI